LRLIVDDKAQVVAWLLFAFSNVTKQAITLYLRGHFEETELMDS
jgi:hypothetical protein